MIETVKVKGKDIPAIFSFSALALYMDKKEMKANQITDALIDIKLSDIPLLAWCAFKKAHEKKGLDFPYTVLDVEQWIDDEPELAADVIKTFNNAQSKVTESPGNKKKAGKANR